VDQPSEQISAFIRKYPGNTPEQERNYVCIQMAMYVIARVTTFVLIAVILSYLEAFSAMLFLFDRKGIASTGQPIIDAPYFNAYWSTMPYV
jgi:hypothetical protein